MEGRPSAKGNADQPAMPRTQSRANGMEAVLERIRQAGERDKEAKFTALYHHVCNPDHLREGYFHLKRQAAPGVDGETWQQYGQDLESNLQDSVDEDFVVTTLVVHLKKRLKSSLQVQIFIY